MATGEQQLKVRMPTDMDPIFANLVLVVDNGSEFILDFAQALPNTTNANIKARIVMTAINAKRMNNALGEHVAKFEEKFGVVNLPDDLATQLFKPEETDEPS